MPTLPGAQWSADKVRRTAELQDLYNSWPSDDPDDDPEFVRRAREIMGEPPLRSAS